MTNGIAIGLGAVVLAMVGANYALGWGLDVFVGRLLLDATEWLAFWR